MSRILWLRRALSGRKWDTTGPASVEIRDDEVTEAVEEVVGIVRPGGGLGVVLNREGRDVEGAKTLDDLVVEADVAHLDPAVAVGAIERALERRLHGEPVVVGGDLHA